MPLLLVLVPAVALVSRAAAVFAFFSTVSMARERKQGSSKAWLLLVRKVGVLLGLAKRAASYEVTRAAVAVWYTVTPNYSSRTLRKSGFQTHVVRQEENLQQYNSIPTSRLPP